MDLLAAAVGLKSAMNQQTLALSVLKQSAEVNSEIADIVASVSASSRGAVVDIAA